MLTCRDTECILRIRHATSFWLFLDYDGTLADFAVNPDIVTPDTKLIELISQLSRHPAFRVAIVSGRRLLHVRKLVPIYGIWLAGTYGIELLNPLGEEVKREKFDHIRSYLDEQKAEWEELIAGLPGFYLEDKGWSLAIHARLAPDELAEELIASARKLAIEAVSETGLYLLGGHKFLEICPSTIDKGSTVEYLLAKDPLPGSLPVYIGDDDKDELGFAAVKVGGGVAILTAPGDRDTHADCYLESPSDVRAFLAGLIADRS